MIDFETMAEPTPAEVVERYLYERQNFPHVRAYMIDRTTAIAAAMRTIHERGEQPSPGKIQKELGLAVTHNLNGKDSATYARVMTELGYERRYSVNRLGPARWRKK